MPDESVRSRALHAGEDIGDIIHVTGDLELKVRLEPARNDFVPQGSEFGSKPVLIEDDDLHEDLCPF
jgi:hypothetical protein